MARAVWRGAIQFGLVTIPVRLYLATESKGVSFNMLHASCGSRIQMKIYCPADDEVVPRSDTVKGFEYTPGQYVTVTEDDLEAVPLKTVRAIEIEQFVPAAAKSDGRFAKQAYYLEPEPIGKRAFGLLREVLADKGLQAICKIVLRDREQLAALDPFGSTMLLTTLYWPDEVRSTAELDLADAGTEVKPAERAMAEQLVAAMTGEFDAAAYRDEYREALMAVIDRKVAGAEVGPVPEAPAGGALVDLMAALEASEAAARAAKTEAAASEAPGAAAGAQPQEASTTRPARRRKTA
jgi:DNA end-binding protein Ku